ncbi:protein FAR1-RELATED SEQUENCE 5-like [Dioscorea cayenensis subsp. rotundata]|uniref:Protein FAR1-RELATED SEQUENCE n=1 Tax=Dioscorea cayennensis subsp. rotundata TaxID=55577 RepID=A0AB40CKI2_DIOCR|nr:protein FAR1-RELATED SEQUENCE 5-like [Dioscorea cayenensis subsp. rotundata]
MGKAIAKVFPNSGHQLCSWHIGRNLMKYLVDLKSKEGFLGDYNNRLHRSASTEAFESKWAGMTSTQRSKSINSFFDGFVNSQTPLDEFVMQYDKALCARRNDEENEDFKTLNSMPNFHTGHPIERHAGEVYTRAVFNIFQEELRESDSMLAERIHDGTDHAKYKIYNHIVIFRRDGIEHGEPIGTCSCKKFEIVIFRRDDIEDGEPIGTCSCKKFEIVIFRRDGIEDGEPIGTFNLGMQACLEL